jgi:predicted ATP-dependent endonuclease of OLD family
MPGDVTSRMQLERLVLQKYKAFDAQTEVEIRPLTVLVGANNAGKSALARALPLFAGVRTIAACLLRPEAWRDVRGPDHR